MDELSWPPSPEILEQDRLIAFEQWGERTKWVENSFSNFIPLVVPLPYKNLTYLTIEHFYQAMKSREQAYREAIVKCETPSKAKFLARRVKVRPDWDQVKIPLMSFAQNHRILTDLEFQIWLYSTKGQYIYEWNNWDDRFWGVSIYTGKGENTLGRILMHLRYVHCEEEGEVPF